jgi:hypothetical protein
MIRVLDEVLIRLGLKLAIRCFVIGLMLCAICIAALVLAGAYMATTIMVQRCIAGHATLQTLSATTSELPLSPTGAFHGLLAASDAPFELIPIDHGFAFPSWRHIGDVNQEWAHWPQARQPFDEDTRAYIESLDAISDMAMLNVSLTLGSESNIDFLRAVAVGTVLVQCAARNGLTLHEIAMMLVREDSRPSAVERVLQTLARDIDAADDESAVLAGASTGVVPDGNCLQLIVRAERSDLSPHTKGKGGGGSWSESTFDIEVEQRFISIFYERLEAEIHRRARSSMQHGPSGLSSSRSGS